MIILMKVKCCLSTQMLKLFSFLMLFTYFWDKSVSNVVYLLLVYPVFAPVYLLTFRATGDELAVPLSFKHVLTYKNLHFWNMECPIGYAALSGVATLNIFGISSLSFPDDTDRYRCVHKNFTERKELYYHF